jgi:hypothetical protein
MDTESSLVDATKAAEIAPQKTCRPSPIVLTLTTNLVQLQKQLKNVVKDDFEFLSTRNGTRVVTKGMDDFEAIKAHFSTNTFPFSARP